MQVTVASRFEGAPGRGQGGYSAGLLDEGVPIRAWFRAPIPMDVPLEVQVDGPRRRVMDGDTLVIETHPAELEREPLGPVPMQVAVEARDAGEAVGYPDRITSCYSCGGAGSLRVHAGPIEGTAIWATPVTYPDWTATDGIVDVPHLWAPVDCAAGYAAAFDGDRRIFTGWLTVARFRSVEPGQPLVVVAETAPGWDGRKRPARSAMYTEDGDLVTASESLWIST